MQTILQAGLPKAGNYWLWTLIQAALTTANLPTRSHVAEHPIRAVASTWARSFPRQSEIDMILVEPDADWMVVLPRYREKINDFGDYIERVTHCWTHSRVWNERGASTMAAFGKRVYLVRDLRSLIVSRAHYDLTPYKRTEFANPPASFEESLARAVANEPTQWMEHLSTWLEFSETHEVLFVRYEDLRASFLTECTRLLTHLGMPRAEALARSIEPQVSLETMRGRAPVHVRKGAVDEWRELLAPQHLAAFPAGVDGLMRRFGYVEHP